MNEKIDKAGESVVLASVSLPLAYESTVSWRGVPSRLFVVWVIVS